MTFISGDGQCQLFPHLFTEKWVAFCVTTLGLYEPTTLRENDSRIRPSAACAVDTMFSTRARCAANFD